MSKKKKIEVLAVLEAYRLHAEAKNEQNTDYAIRVCQAIIAGVFGYSGRRDWSDAIQAAGLIDYDYDTDKKEQYRILSSIVKNIKV